MARVNGAVLYEGPSELDGSPIVVIVTGLASGSANTKTGSMLQTWILRSDVEPHKALKTGEDSSICGNCPHRPANFGACYVLVHNAPLAVYRGWKRGIYPNRKGAFGLRSVGQGRLVRIGAYGDPAAVPSRVWSSLLKGAKHWTGYTHQWSYCDQGLREFCMASVDTEEEQARAVSMGWRTFRVAPFDSGMPIAGEIACPASDEAGKVTTCERCKLCAGTANRGKNVVIRAHGAKKKKANVL